VTLGNENALVDDMRNYGAILGIILGGLLFLFLLGELGMVGGLVGHDMMNGFGSPFVHGYRGIGVLLSAVVIVVLIGGSILLIDWLLRNVGTGDISLVAKSPIQILKSRYARGEITKEQFDAIRHDLES
jgi:putative membrane protein